jgi:hypothetical protein
MKTNRLPILVGALILLSLLKQANCVARCFSPLLPIVIGGTTMDSVHNKSDTIFTCLDADGTTNHMLVGGYSYTTDLVPDYNQLALLYDKDSNLLWSYYFD